MGTGNKYFKELLNCNWLTNSIKVLTAFGTNCHIKIAKQKTEKPCAIAADLKRNLIRKGPPIFALSEYPHQSVWQSRQAKHQNS